MIELILTIIGLAMISTLATESEIAILIKKFLFVDRERSFLVALSKPKQYFKVLPKFFQYTVIVPILIYIFTVVFGLIRLIIRGASCSTCLSFHVGWVYFFFYAQSLIIPALIYGGVVSFITLIIDRINVWK